MSSATAAETCSRRRASVDAEQAHGRDEPLCEGRRTFAQTPGAVPGTACVDDGAAATRDTLTHSIPPALATGRSSCRHSTPISARASAGGVRPVAAGIATRKPCVTG